MEKLDWAFANTKLMEHFPHSVVRNLPIIRSDHGLIILDISGIGPSDSSGCGQLTPIVQQSATQHGPRVMLALMHTYWGKR